MCYFCEWEEALLQLEELEEEERDLGGENQIGS